ncbi:hypothetical protein EVAR_89072_1 [Eumeta japonica]|uniref:Uncharacterized protein n=1 Tax=Eumeta variegata TaxID=151549 RepID=A0A4C1XJW6_EUMVA|nr:hypothetical protein EVAR_89072_1 [Eumeta japonica]
MLRCQKKKWSTQVTVWYPRVGTRRQGQEARRWEDELKMTLGLLWMRIAADKKQWKVLEEAFAVFIRPILRSRPLLYVGCGSFDHKLPRWLGAG